MAQFTFADEDDPQPAPAAPPTPAAAAPPPPAAPATSPAPTPAAPATKPGGFSFADFDEEPTPAQPPAQAPLPTPQVAAPPPPQAPAAHATLAPAQPAGAAAADASGPAAPKPSAAPSGNPTPAPARANPAPPPAGSASSQRAPQAPAPQAPAAPQVLAAPQVPQAPAPRTPQVAPPVPTAPQAPIAPQVLAAPQVPGAASDNPVRDAARRAAQAPDHGAAAGMVGGAIPNVAGPRAPSPPQPNQVSNPPAAPVAPQAPVPPQAGAPTAKPTTARQAAQAQATAQRAAAAAPIAPTVHAITPGMSNATITPDVPSEPGRDWRSELNRLDPFLGWLFRVGAIVSILSLGYIGLGLFGGAGSEEALRDPATHDRALQFSRDILLASRIAQWALLATAVSALLIALDVGMVGPIVAGLGFLLHFGLPIVLGRLGATPATMNVASVMRTTGMALLIMGLLKYSFDFIHWLQEMPNRVRARADVGSSHKAEAKQQQAAKHATMFSPCWSLPFCREVIRLQCPAFLARTKCWKFGRGCYCDEEMIGRIIRGESLDRIKAPTQMSTRKPPCGRCHIFIEHQALKYKVMAPLAVPATIGIMFVGWSTFEKLFLGLNDRMNALWGSIGTVKFNPVDVNEAVQREAAQAAAEAAERTSQYGLWIFGILAGFFLLIYISKFIEWAVLQKKW